MTRTKQGFLSNAWLLTKMAFGLVFLMVIFAWGAFDPLFDWLYVAPQYVSLYLTRGTERRKALRALLLASSRYGPRMRHGRDGLDYLNQKRLVDLKDEYDRLRKECIETWRIRPLWLPGFGTYKPDQTH